MKGGGGVDGTRCDQRGRNVVTRCRSRNAGCALGGESIRRGPPPRSVSARYGPNREQRDIITIIRGAARAAAIQDVSAETALRRAVTFRTSQISSVKIWFKRPVCSCQPGGTHGPLSQALRRTRPRCPSDAKRARSGAYCRLVVV